MPLPYHPCPGTILICDYSRGGFRPPEMVKRRLSVVISPKLKRRNNLLTVVPLTETCPQPVEEWHLHTLIDVPDPWGKIDRWAACDMVATVGYDRLEVPYTKHPVTGSRIRNQIELGDDVVEQLRSRVALALGIKVAS